MTTLDKQIPLKDFRTFLNMTFNETRPHERLVIAMFERFKSFKLEGDRERVVVSSESTM